MTGGPLKPIQVVPPGLMGLLQLKQTGRLPDELLDQVRPVIELRDWYMTARRVDALGLFPSVPSLTVATGNIGLRNFLVAASAIAVPQGQVWYVEGFEANGVGAAATDVLNIAMAIQNPLLNQVHRVGPMNFETVSGRTRFYSAHADRGFWALPGDLFAVLVHDVLSAGITLFCDLRVTVLPS